MHHTYFNKHIIWMISHILAVESYLAISPDGQLGVTGEGSMLENASGLSLNFTSTMGFRYFKIHFLQVFLILL